jgi:hypothetical protein
MQSVVNQTVDSFELCFFAHHVMVALDGLKFQATCCEFADQFAVFGIARSTH